MGPPLLLITYSSGAESRKTGDDFMVFSEQPILVVRLLLVGCLLAAVSLLAAETQHLQAAVTIIPKPASMTQGTGTFYLRPDTIVYVQGDASETLETARYLARVLSPTKGFSLKVKPCADSERSPAGILLTTHEAAATLGDEGYVLDIMPDRIVARAKRAAGFFYAVQTLRQLLPPEASLSDRTLPCLQIEDRPRFPWRGLMLDPARQFLSTDFLKRYIDLLALYKLNRLHLHLTDDTAWTIEIKKYPQLTDMRRWPMRPAGRARGVYRHDQVRELAAYAASRHVMLVPEIEMPAHNAIPGWVLPGEVLCSNNPYRTHQKSWDDKETSQWTEPCAANPKTLEIYQNILREVMDVFPAPYIHVGGDEYFGVAWAHCPECRKLIETENLRRQQTDELRRLFGNKCLGSSEKYLVYRYLMTRICDFVRSQGRQPVLWDDLSWRGRFPQGAVIMQWHYQGGIDYMQHVATPENPAAEAARAGRDTVVGPFSHLYFDIDSTLEAVYRLDPMPAGLTPAEQSRVLGPHAPVWDQREDQVDGRTFPRLYALAEITWTPRETGNLAEFLRRVAVHEKQRAAMPPAPRPKTTGQ
jgi:hexosaminidase